LRRVPTCPRNVYGEQRHPTDIERDTSHTTTWREMTQMQQRSQMSSSPSDHFQETNPGPSPHHSSDDPDQSLGECSEGSDDSSESARSVDEVEDTLSYLVKHGGVRNLNALLAIAVPPGSEIPDTCNICEWSFKDIKCMPSVQQKDWIEACCQKLDSLQEHRVYDLVNPLQGQRVIKNRWVFDQKTDRRKHIQLVAKGFSQVEGIDYDNVFSPVVQYKSVHLMIVLAAQQQWHMTSIDIKTAFLYGELDEELFMEQPEGFTIKGQEHKVFCLKQALYGLKQAALQWWKALDKSMACLGFRCTKSDSGIFVLTESSRPHVIVIVYVDDAIFMGPDRQLVQSKKAHFMKEWECWDLEDTKEFLQMKIHHQGTLISLEQKDYLHTVLEHFNMHNTRAAPTPLLQGYIPTPNESPKNPKCKSQYQQVISSLLYLMLGTRSNIAFAVTKMS